MVILTNPLPGIIIVVSVVYLFIMYHLAISRIRPARKILFLIFGMILFSVAIFVLYPFASVEVSGEVKYNWNVTKVADNTTYVITGEFREPVYRPTAVGQHAVYFAVVTAIISSLFLLYAALEIFRRV